ncbi:MAG: ThuA domain-containing protein [Prolixibacteraceae bacterium]
MKHYLIPLVISFFMISVYQTTVKAQPGLFESPVKTRSVKDLLSDKEDDREQIEKALPGRITVKPEQPRRLLIFNLNVNYGGHRSIDYAGYAFARMGEKHGAWETVITKDTNVFRAENLKQFDAVFFNNNVGNLFKDKTLRQNLLDFVYAGGGVMGVHGTTAAFTDWPGAHEDWPPFGIMIGARGASHRINTEHVFMDLEEPDHPVVQAFDGNAPDFKDEFFRFKDPYSRDLVRVLLSIDKEKTDMEQGRAYGDVIREDNDYAVAWVKNYGRGRIFYNSFAHNPYVFWDPLMLDYFQDALQFVLGDLEAPATPSAKLTPAMEAQEKLGWKFGIEAYTFKDNTFFETIEKTADLGLLHVGGLNVQQVSDEIPKKFDYNLSEEELMAVRNKLIKEGLRMPTYFIFDIPGDEETVKKIFEFGRKMGIETFISEPKPENLDIIEKYCEEYNIRVGLHNHAPRLSPVYYDPDKLLEVVEGRSPLIGAACDFGYWIREGIDPLEAIKKLGQRVITLQMHDLNEKSAEAHDVPWGTGVVDLDGILNYLEQENIEPVLFGLEYSYNWNESLPEIKKSIEYFNRKAIELAK